MVNRYEVKFLAAAIKAGYLSTERARDLYERYSKAQTPERGNSIVEFARVRGILLPSQIEVISRVVGEPPTPQGRVSKSIGPYRIEAKIGEGGMGLVVKGTHPASGQVVAIKILPRRLYDDPEYIQRFTREARNAARLNHPNIMRALEVNKTEEGLYYYVMEYIDGETVQDILDRQKRMTETQAIPVAIQVCRALQHAHEQGIIHRDIKPDNIMVNRQGVVKLTDLGLAKEIVDTNVTQTGIALGTPHYMSPEQARGDRTVDTRSDIYSLGASLYHMVTGKPPFEGNSAAVVITKHLLEQVPSPRDLSPDLSDGFCQVIQKMMAKEQVDRYPTPSDVIVDLERAARGEPPVAARDSDRNKSSVRMPAVTTTVQRRRGGDARAQTEKTTAVIQILAMIIGVALLALATIILLSKTRPQDSSGPENETAGPGPSTPGTGRYTERDIRASREALLAAKAFDQKNGSDPEKQDEAVRLWERAAQLSRGTAAEREAAKGLQAARDRRAILLAMPSQNPSAEDPDLEFDQIRDQAKSWAETGQWVLLLRAYDLLAARNVPAPLLQKIRMEQDQNRALVTEKARDALADLDDLLDTGRLDEAERRVQAWSGTGLAEFDAPLAAARKRLDEEKSFAASRAATAELQRRLALVDKALARITNHEYAQALAILREEGGGDKTEGMTALRDLAGLMDGLWTRVPQSARGLVGKSISYHGNDLEVADVQGDALVLRKGPGPSGPPFKVPFRGLALNDLLPLLLNEMNPRTPDYHVRAAAFWLWHWRPMVYTSARDQAGKLGADTRTLDAAFALLQQAHNEADAKKPWDAAQQAIAKGQWRLAEKNLTELMQNFGESLLVKERSESLRYLRALALRDGRPLVLLGQRRDLGDGLIELTYDFRQPESLRDWIVSSRWVHAGRGLDICRTNWLTHAARFQEIVEWRCEVRGLTQSNKENAFWGWLIGAEAMPETLSATAFPGALCGRISAVAGTPGGLWGPSEQALGLSERTTIGERMSCVSVFSLEPGLARWTINGSEFLVAKDPDLPRTRNLVLLNPGLSVRLRSVSLRGRLLPAWEEQAQTASDRSYDLAQGVRNALADRRSAPILQDMNWLAESQRVWWSVVGDELRFQGAPGAPPLTLPVGVRDATWSGRFRYGRSRDAGCRLGFRLSGSTGYYVDLLADRRVILASKMTAATDGGSEPLKLTSLREKTDVQFVPETWHSFEIRFVDDEIEVRLDGEAQFTVKDSSFDAGDLSLSGVSDDGRSPPVSFKQLELRPPQ